MFCHHLPFLFWELPVTQLHFLGVFLHQIFNHFLVVFHRELKLLHLVRVITLKLLVLVVLLYPLFGLLVKQVFQLRILFLQVADKLILMLQLLSKIQCQIWVLVVLVGIHWLLSRQICVSLNLSIRLRGEWELLWSSSWRNIMPSRAPSLMFFKVHRQVIWFLTIGALWVVRRTIFLVDAASCVNQLSGWRFNHLKV